MKHIKFNEEKVMPEFKNPNESDTENGTENETENGARSGSVNSAGNSAENGTENETENGTRNDSVNSGRNGNIDSSENSAENILKSGYGNSPINENISEARIKSEYVNLSENLKQNVQSCYSKIISKFPHSGKRLLIDEPMSSYSSFKVGGKADIVFMIESEEELVFAIKCAKNEGIPLYVLGNASNLLISDSGLRGLVILIGKDFSHIQKIGDTMLLVEAGALLSNVSKFAAKENLTGMEFAAGIPGSIGGAIFMNAGAYDGCMADIIVKTQCYDQKNDEIILFDGVNSHEFGYRESIFEKKDLIVIRTWISLSIGNTVDIYEKMALFSAKRKTSQPLEFPSAGSTFKRPLGYFAGKLIEDAGLKGMRVGGACVSTKHAGFIVNDNMATAKDIKDLIEQVQKCVYEKHNVKIDTEVKILGDWEL